jgi:hypothetical protein
MSTKKRKRHSPEQIVAKLRDASAVAVRNLVLTIDRDNFVLISRKTRYSSVPWRRSSIRA